MKLLIISNMAHYLRDGQVVGWGPTVQEIDHLSRLFDGIDHIACLHPETAPDSSLPYTSAKVRLIPVQPAGGETLGAKLGILRLFPGYARTILRHLKDAEAVHVRCPANISLLAVLLLAVRRRPELRWIKFATNWHPDGREAWSSTFQRWWLRRKWLRARITVNGEYPDQPGHVRSFLNPCLDEAELGEAGRVGDRKPEFPPLRILFVGGLNANKGVLRALEVLRRLRGSGLDARCEIVGDGPEREVLREKVNEWGLTESTTLHGWVPRTALGAIYARNHIALLTSRSEGWPKVLSEAMAYGVVPVASAISCIPNYLARFKTGRSVAWNDIDGFTGSILEYARSADLWREESMRAMKAATKFSYADYLDEVSALLGIG